LQAGASAFLNHNSPTAKSLGSPRVRIVEWKEKDPLVSIPAFSVSFGFAETVKSINAAGMPVKLQINAQNLNEVVPTFNVLCETRGNIFSKFLQLQKCAVIYTLLSRL
jgi:hypothetical protein